jgi:hypothetical protein
MQIAHSTERIQEIQGTNLLRIDRDPFGETTENEEPGRVWHFKKVQCFAPRCVNGLHGSGQYFEIPEAVTNVVRQHPNDGLSGVVRRFGQAEGRKRMSVLVVIQELAHPGPATDFLNDPVQFIVGHIAEALSKAERTDVVP